MMYSKKIKAQEMPQREPSVVSENGEIEKYV